MSYWDLTSEQLKELESNGIDYDLQACLEHNPQGEFDIMDIEKVLAVWQGENDGDDWRWIFQLKDKRFVFLQGGCDYTGWDCQSWASHYFADSPEDAASCALGCVPITEQNTPANAGLGHLINILGGTYGDNVNEVQASLLEQLAKGKDETWREGKDKEFGING